MVRKHGEHMFDGIKTSSAYLGTFTILTQWIGIVWDLFYFMEENPINVA
jgi:hypothetical protein